MSESLNWFENFLFFLGFPKRPPEGSKCYRCGYNDPSGLIDLGDGDYICVTLWNSYPRKLCILENNVDKSKDVPYEYPGYD